MIAALIILAIIVIILIIPIKSRVTIDLDYIVVYIFNFKVATISIDQMLKRSATVASVDPGEMKHRANKLELIRYLKFKKNFLSAGGHFIDELSAPALAIGAGGVLSIIKNIVLEYNIPFNYQLSFVGDYHFHLESIFTFKLGKIIYHYFYLEEK